MDEFVAAFKTFRFLDNWFKKKCNKKKKPPIRRNTLRFVITVSRLPLVNRMTSDSVLTISTLPLWLNEWLTGCFVASITHAEYTFSCSHSSCHSLPFWLENISIISIPLEMIRNTFQYHSAISTFSANGNPISLNFKRFWGDRAEDTACLPGILPICRFQSKFFNLHKYNTAERLNSFFILR